MLKKKSHFVEAMKPMKKAMLPIKAQLKRQNASKELKMCFQLLFNLETSVSLAKNHTFIKMSYQPLTQKILYSALPLNCSRTILFPFSLFS